MTRFLVVDGVQWRVHMVRYDEAPEAGLVAVSGFGHVRFVPSGETTLDETSDAFAAVPNEALAHWLRRARQLPQHRRFPL